MEQFRPRRVLVFGSRVRGDALRDSDLDLLVVTEAFAALQWLQPERDLL
ncbi:MAG: nucleotidyltransferase domain-containing protein [Gemmatimonadota bacterium]